MKFAWLNGNCTANGQFAHQWLSWWVLMILLPLEKCDYFTSLSTSANTVGISFSVNWLFPYE